jgi:hypothetical protein
VLHNNCFVPGPDGMPLPFGPNGTDPSNEGVMCSRLSTNWGGNFCPAGEVCLAEGQSPEDGQMDFDTIGAAMVFQFMVTSMIWGIVTSYLMDATTGAAFFYSLFLIIVVFMFFLNLVLAVVADSYLETHQKENVRRLLFIELPLELIYHHTKICMPQRTPLHH